MLIRYLLGILVGMVFYIGVLYGVPLSACRAGAEADSILLQRHGLRDRSRRVRPDEVRYFRGEGREVVVNSSSGGGADWLGGVLLWLWVCAFLVLFIIGMVKVLRSLFIEVELEAGVNERYVVWVRLAHTNETWVQPRVGFESSRVGLFGILECPSRDVMKLWVRRNRMEMGHSFPIYAFGELYR